MAGSSRTVRHRAPALQRDIAFTDIIGGPMAKYGKKAQSKVKRAMHERKHGTLKSGR